jgi:hypothetical protein
LIAVNDDRVSRINLFSKHASLISRGLEALVLLSLLTSAFPFALAQPIWWLRLSDSAVGLAPVILVAVILVRLSSMFYASDPSYLPMHGRHALRTARRWASVYALLIPLQLIGFTWLWFDSDSQVNARILQGETNRISLQQALAASASDRELQALLASTNLGPLPAFSSPSLADHKQQLTQALAANGAAFNTNLRSERSAMLANSIPGTLRVLLGSLIVGAILFTITRQL